MNMDLVIRGRRSIRHFLPKAISEETIREIVDLARLYASAANLQPIKFIAALSETLTDAIFPLLRWAAYLPDFQIPKEKQPTGYVILTTDANRNTGFDTGAAATTLMLAAQSRGLGSCALASFDEKRLSGLLSVPEGRKIAIVIALGYPDQDCAAVPFAGDVKYYIDDTGTFCVPRRSLDQVLDIR